MNSHLPIDSVERLARAVSEMRKNAGLTQEALADLADVNRNYVGLIEREENSASVDVLESLARALKIDPTDLLARPKRAQ